MPLEIRLTVYTDEDYPDADHMPRENWFLYRDELYYKTSNGSWAKPIRKSEIHHRELIEALKSPKPALTSREINYVARSLGVKKHLLREES